MDAATILNAAAERHKAGDLTAAEAGYRQILGAEAIRGAIHNLAVALEATGRNDEALALFRAATVVAPDDAAAHRRLANHARQTRQPEIAEPAYRRALALDPSNDEAWTEYGMALLGAGRFAEGWRCYEHRHTRLKMIAQKLTMPEWQGEPLDGKTLFLWREQGFGDQIMMARFLKHLGAARVTYAAQPALQRLFAQLPVDFMPVEKDVVVPSHDYWALPMSLPDRLGVTLEDLPKTSAPYLTAQPAANPGGRIGLVWRGEPKNMNDRFRSLPEAQAARLLAHPGVISLHPEHTGARDLQDTAELIAGLDLVISVDTAVAHLAGAMGRPVWVLLAQHALDWQWMWGRPQSPWYPSARLVWQERPGDWASLVGRVLDELPAALAA